MWSGFRSFLSGPGRAGRLVPVWVVLVAFACAGRSTMVSADDDATAGSGASGGKPGHAGAGTGGSMQLAGRGGTAGTPSGTGGTGDVPYDDPGCPDAAPPASVIECDPFDAAQSCAEGLACKPDVEHPFGSGCDQQTVNMRCVVSGSGQQGDSCEGGMGDCADGFICVIGAAHGARCLRMCPLDGSTRCPSGYVCGATDADGIGVCA